MLTGNNLLTLVNELQAQNHKISDIVRACGYEIEGKLKYTQFYTELLNAKGILNNDTEEETEISDEYQEQYQKLCETYAENAVKAFLKLYDESDLENFKEAYYGYYDSKESFAEDLVNDVYSKKIPFFLVIDWTATWNSALRFDYDFEDGFVFSKNW